MEKESQSELAKSLFKEIIMSHAEYLEMKDTQVRIDFEIRFLKDRNEQEAKEIDATLASLNKTQLKGEVKEGDAIAGNLARRRVMGMRLDKLRGKRQEVDILIEEYEIRTGIKKMIFEGLTADEKFYIEYVELKKYVKSIDNQLEKGKGRLSQGEFAVLKQKKSKGKEHLKKIEQKLKIPHLPLEAAIKLLPKDLQKATPLDLPSPAVLALLEKTKNLILPSDFPIPIPGTQAWQEWVSPEEEEQMITSVMDGIKDQIEVAKESFMSLLAQREILLRSNLQQKFLLARNSIDNEFIGAKKSIDQVLI